MSKFTPGPWEASQSSGGWYRKRWAISSKIYSTPTITDGRDSIADVMGQTKEEAKANAHLIAAVPELYEYGYDLAMLVLQSDFYQRPDVKEAVNNLLTTFSKADGKE